MSISYSLFPHLLEMGSLIHLPPCAAGTSCTLYRTDPAHVASHSHPCKFGSYCRKIRDPVHTRALTHPDVESSDESDTDTDGVCIILC